MLVVERSHLSSEFTCAKADHSSVNRRLGVNFDEL